MELSVEDPDTGLSQSLVLKSQASQGHGFDWENTIRTEIFDLKEEENNRLQGIRNNYLTQNNSNKEFNWVNKTYK